MGSKGKGGSFEREVSCRISLWWTCGERDDVFYRSNSSGGRFTMRNKSGKDTALQGGDITCSDPIGEQLIRNWNIEVKTGYGKKAADGVFRWDVLDLIDSKQKKPVLQSMWGQCIRDAGISNREPILIFRRNLRSPCIMIRTVYELQLQEWFASIDHSTINIDSFDRCTIMSLLDFFSWIPDIRISLKL